MRVLFISTINGKLDEGMRNIATHLGRELEKQNSIRYVGLKDFGGIFKNLWWSQKIIICARADKKLYTLVSVLELLRPVACILVQSPKEDFKSLFSKRQLKCLFFTLTLKDAQCIPKIKEEQICWINTGIDIARFKPVSVDKQIELKRKLGFEQDKLLVLHVGHCSSGRRVEKLGELDSKQFERVVITSGMFEDSAVRKVLDDCQVKVLSGYRDNIEEYYQAADVYLFPTCSGEYVISIPLSVMEALACGTPVVAYKSLYGLEEILLANSQALVLVDEDAELDNIIIEQSKEKGTKCLLEQVVAWSDVAHAVHEKMEVYRK